MTADRNGDAPVVLHVPFTYFPDPCGGTEVYVRGLAQRLCDYGYASVIAAPAKAPDIYEDSGLPVHRFATDPAPNIELAYGIPDEIAAVGFAHVLRKVRPAVVHLHARSSAVSERLVDVAHAHGAAVAFTYHTPTASCPRGSMMRYGQIPCDGKIDIARCVPCTLQGQGIPSAVSRVICASQVSVLGDMLGRLSIGPLAKLRIPELLSGMGGRFRSFIDKVDHIVAVCDWVRDVLLRNNVPEAKITLSRQGISSTAGYASATCSEHPERPLKVAYFGRMDPTKGPDLLAKALPLIPRAPLRIDIYAVVQANPDAIERLHQEAHRDDRLNVFPAVEASEVISTMAQYDVIAVPSRWLETGPLVVLEAFAAGVPVIGARLGGIAELVRDNVDGLLLPPDDAPAWAAELARLAEDRSHLRRIRAGIMRPRTMEACAGDMACIYRKLSGSPPSSSRLAAVELDGLMMHTQSLSRRKEDGMPTSSDTAGSPAPFASTLS